MPNFDSGQKIDTSGFTLNREFPRNGIPLHPIAGPDVVADTLKAYGGRELQTDDQLPQDKYIVLFPNDPSMVSLNDPTMAHGRLFAFATTVQIDDACLAYCMNSGMSVVPKIVSTPAT